MVESERQRNEQAAAAMDAEWQRVERQMAYHTPEAAQRYDQSPKGGGDNVGNSAVPIQVSPTMFVDVAPSGLDPRRTDGGVTPGFPCVFTAGAGQTTAGAPKQPIMTAAGTTART